MLAGLGDRPRGGERGVSRRSDPPRGYGIVGRTTEPPGGGKQRLRVTGKGLDLDPALDTPGVDDTAYLERVAGPSRILHNGNVGFQLSGDDGGGMYFVRTTPNAGGGANFVWYNSEVQPLSDNWHLAFED